MDDTRLAHRCGRCGKPLDADAPEGLCPSCLLAAAAVPEPDTLAGEAPTVLARDGGAGAMPRRELVEGELFGAYRIGRLLGRGGMGEVYEAEHLDTGRRLALKTLRARLNEADDRARFLREGQLAASVSHPHTVYIFGSEEIDGTPVIAMELVPGGTLKDRVDTAGPLPVPDAVAAVLGIIGGLDAAQAAGILHRDIKPSNCFVDADGSVKVGDFGLSISTLARDVQIGGRGFQGTPQFAPPEQLRGEPLDVRADIYAVGATLYYLLSGHTPFEAPDLAGLFTKITSEPATPLRDRRPGVPASLAAAVHQCLARDPRDRPPTYAALAELLRPFSTAGVVPAPLGLRTVAALVDVFLVSLPISLMSAWDLSTAVQRGTRVQIDPWASPIVMTYYFLLEGFFGASIGKRLFGLRVVAVEGGLTWARVLVRSVVYFAPGLLVSAVTFAAGRAELEAFLLAHPVALVMLVATPSMSVLYFLTIRRTNGFAAVHDLASGTRVVARSSRLERQARRGLESRDHAPAAKPARTSFRCGPFEVLGVAGEADPGQLLNGFDPVLRRRIWIHAVPAGTPAVAGARRDLGRLGRVRWLTGRRSAGENWDAYEAPDGRPLAAPSARPLAWADAKPWLVDIVNEVAASSADGTMPRLDLDRVWLRDDGHAVLLDFRAPGLGAPDVDPHAGAADEPGLAPMPAAFLARLARLARAGVAAAPAGSARRPLAMPRSAALLVEAWQRGDVGSIDTARAALATVAAAPDRVLRWRRAIPLALASAPALMLTAGALGVLPQLTAAVTPERMEVYSLLDALGSQPTTPIEPGDREAMEIYLAGKYGSEIGTDRFWALLPLQGGLQRHRAVANRVVAAHPAPSPEAVEAARASIAPRLERIRRNYEDNVQSSMPRVRVFIIASLAGLGLGVPFVAGLVSSIVVPGGILTRLVGLTVVTADGAVVGRLRSAVRALVAWSPAVVWLAWLGPSPVDRSLAMTVSPLLPVAIAMAVLAAGAIWAVLRPERGPHDWIAGTWIVPR